MGEGVDLVTSPFGVLHRIEGTGVVRDGGTGTTGDTEGTGSTEDTEALGIPRALGALRVSGALRALGVQSVPRILKALMALIAGALKPPTAL